MIHDYSFEEKYAAIVRKDPAFEGVFITAVKTTGIFCRPVCTARKPKPENVIFYDSPEEAILHGYRPCQVCKPMQYDQETPGQIKALIETLQQDPFQRIRDFELKKRGLEPSQVRRWFKKHHNLSFHAYQRMLRINTAFQKISTGESVTAAAFDVGYNSVSGFNDSFRSIFGEAPSLTKDKSVIHITRFTTPLGPMFGCATDKGVCLLEFTNRRMLEREFMDLRKRLNAAILPGENKHLTKLREEITEYFNGKRKIFTVPLHTPGTPFHGRVWEALQHIPYGTTISYKELALRMGIPSSIRAVANANGMNRVAIIIPCHRIIGENGNLTGYAGGLPRKKWLIEFEQREATKLAIEKKQKIQPE
jgi:AraC family transcriptional regulator, regulatory protein of adaptative response / methylated-DNA-[protein]-cysteine methyltransferase